MLVPTKKEGYEMSKRVSKKQSNPQLRAAVTSIVLTIALILLTAVVGGLLMLNGWLPEQADGILACVGVFLSAFIGPMPMMAAIGKKQLPIAYAVAIILSVLLIFSRWIFWPAASYGNWFVLICAFAGATASGLLRARKPKRKH